MQIGFFCIRPKNRLDTGVQPSEKTIDAILIGVYSMLDGTPSIGWEAAATNWVFGAIRGMIGNKGSDSNDREEINPIQSFSETATNNYLNVKWREIYESISMCNSVILVTKQALVDGTLTNTEDVSDKILADLQEGHYTEVGSWTSGWTANGYRMIRYADILLLLAECQIETNDLPDVPTNINLIRARVANTAGFVKEADAVTNAANYVINQYPA